jgi:hypothetical protein
MSHTLMSLDAEWRRLARASCARRALKQWSIAHPALRGVADLDALLERRRDDQAAPAILRALAVLAPRRAAISPRSRPPAIPASATRTTVARSSAVGPFGFAISPTILGLGDTQSGAREAWREPSLGGRGSTLLCVVKVLPAVLADQ